jgi:hypothetical protein
MSDALLREVKDLIKQGEQEDTQSADQRKAKRLYTKEDDVEILTAFKPFAKEWGTVDTRGRQDIASTVAKQVNRPPNSVFYRLTRVLLEAESLDSISYRHPQEKKAEEEEGEKKEAV